MIQSQGLVLVVGLAAEYMSCELGITGNKSAFPISHFHRVLFPGPGHFERTQPGHFERTQPGRFGRHVLRRAARAGAICNRQSAGASARGSCSCPLGTPDRRPTRSHGPRRGEGPGGGRNKKIDGPPVHLINSRPTCASTCRHFFPQLLL
jgi:hypothetical protein